MAAFLRGDAHCVAAISEEAGSTSAVVRAWACSYLPLSLCLCLFLPRPFRRRVSSLAGGEKGDSEESHLLKTVASGGPWHSYEQGEEALLPGSKIGPNCRRLAWAEAPVASRGAKWGGPVDQAPPLGQNAAGPPGRPLLLTFYVRNTHFPNMF